MRSQVSCYSSDKNKNYSVRNEVNQVHWLRDGVPFFMMPRCTKINSCHFDFNSYPSTKSISKFFKVKVRILHSAVSSPLDHSNSFTLHLLADLFIPTPTRLLCEAFYTGSNYARRLLTHISTAVYSHVLIYKPE